MNRTALIHFSKGTDDNFIEWIEVIEGKSRKKFLNNFKKVMR